MIALVALRVHALSRGGALAAFAVGTLTYGAATYGGALLLLAFFVTSVALGRVGRARKKGLVDTGKTGARDALQVLANGGIATVCLLAWRLGPGPDGAFWFVAFAGAYAAATADTWGTEVGTLAKDAPRSILSGEPLAPGLSGGVSAQGTIAEAIGAGLIAFLTWPALVLATILLGPIGLAMLAGVPHPALSPNNAVTALALPVALGGMLGAIVDSVLGATLQERRWCPACARECETDPHVCGTATTRVRGIPGFSNDAVNAAATLTGALVAAIGWLALNGGR